MSECVYCRQGSIAIGVDGPVCQDCWEEGYGHSPRTADLRTPIKAMSDEELVKRLRDRAKEERLIQSNNEAVATALRGQRLLFDQGHRSPSNTYAVRLALNHEDCARQDAKLAADWDEAADCIEELTAKLAICEKYRDAYAECDRIGTQAVRDLEAKLAECEARLGKAVEALRAFKAFDEMPTRYKRPDVFEVSVRRKLLSTLAEIEGEKG